ncbi:MAG: carbohydrate kinase [Planctomycetaceae bacterium]|nr:carbohydrate kinase [Planctomycetaceae bacterium]
MQLSHPRLQELIEHFPQSRIGVLGDFFLDKYLDVSPQLEEPSVETGKPAHQVVNVRCSPGAAGTVVCNLAALGAGHIHAIGFRGDDGEGYDLAKELNQLDCRTEHLHIVSDAYTPTYLKPRDQHATTLAGEHSRYDTKNRKTTAATVEDSVLQSLDALLPQLDAVIVLDQVEQTNCGIITERVRQQLSAKAQQWPQVIFWADSRRRIRNFPHLTIKPNEFETIGLDNPLPEDKVSLDALRTASEQLRQENQAPVVITRGKHGMWVSDPEWTNVPAVAVEGQLDPTGAGDSATAGTVLALCAGATLPEAAIVGNLVASITIQQISTTGVAHPDQLPARLSLWHQQQQGR